MFHAWCVAIRHHDMGTGPGQSLRCRAADTRTAACHGSASDPARSGGGASRLNSYSSIGQYSTSFRGKVTSNFDSAELMLGTQLVG